MKRQRLGKRYWGEDIYGWFKKYIRRENRNIVKNETLKIVRDELN